jgi:hypothetical protein
MTILYAFEGGLIHEYITYTALEPDVEHEAGL